MTDNTPLSSENNQWKAGDLCLCPYSEDGLLYKATIINIESSSYTVSFDEYGNEEIHALTDLQLQTEEKQEPSAPPSLLAILNPNNNNNTISSTLMSWYLAGYHTGFHQGLKAKKNLEK